MDGDNFKRAGELLGTFGLDGWLTYCDFGYDLISPYFLGIETHAPHCIFIDGAGNHRILAGSMEGPMIQKAISESGAEVKVEICPDFKSLILKVRSLINKPRIALNFGENMLTSEKTDYANYLRAGDFAELRKLAPDTKFFSAAPLIFRLRSVFSDSELKQLRETVKITMEIFESIPEWVTVGMSEIEVKAKLHYEFLKSGKPAFDAIVASGPNSADPHHNSSKKKITKGVLLVDAGLKIRHLESDITWTYWIGGTPPDDFLRAYQALYGAKQAANEHMKPQNPLNLPAIKCREYLAAMGYDHDKLYMHSLGHPVSTVGRTMSRNTPKDHKFAENMVYTNEPGLYWQGKYGIREEDDLIIKKDCAESLSYTPKDPILI